MKKVLAVLALAGALVGCGNQAAEMPENNGSLNSMGVNGYINTCETLNLCGKMYNKTPYSILITYQFNGGNPLRRAWLAAYSETVYKDDVDGFYVPSGCRAFNNYLTYQPGWHKIRGGQTVTITGLRCDLGSKYQLHLTSNLMSENTSQSDLGI